MLAHRNLDIGHIVLELFLIEKLNCFMPAVSQREFAKLYLASCGYLKSVEELHMQILELHKSASS